jgi:hypothetical protein
MLQEKLMYFNLKPKEILMEHTKYTPIRVNVYETGITVPGHSEVSLAAAMPCHLQLCVVLRSSTSKLSCAHYIYVVAL